MPCLVIEMTDNEVFVKAGYTPYRDHFTTWRDCVEDSRQDVSRLEALRKVGLTAAADLMAEEIASNATGV